MIKSKTSKTITLKCGAIVKIRKLAARDFLSIGDLPDVLADRSRAKTDEGKSKIREYSVKLTEIILTECVGPINDGDTTIRIVKKPFHECSESEVSVEEFTSSDEAAEIVEAVTAFSGMNQAAQDAARPFPEESQRNVVSLQHSEDIQSVAK